jgi:hypothetical protein
VGTTEGIAATERVGTAFISARVNLCSRIETAAAENMDLKEKQMH